MGLLCTHGQEQQGVLKCGFLTCTCFCCGGCGCIEGTTPCRGRRGSWASPQHWGSSLGTAGAVVGSQRCSRAAHLSLCLPAPCQAWPGTMRLWVCIALLCTVLCASADRPRIVQGAIRAGQFVRDAARGKLLSPGALPSGMPSPSTAYSGAALRAGKSQLHVRDPAGFCCWMRALISPQRWAQPWAKADLEQCLTLLLLLGPFSSWLKWY